MPGEYQFGTGFAIVITAESGKLFAQATAQPKFELFSYAADKLFLKVVDARIDVVRGADGKVSGIVLNQSGNRLEFKRK